MNKTYLKVSVVFSYITAVILILLAVILLSFDRSLIFDDTLISIEQIKMFNLYLNSLSAMMLAVSVINIIAGLNIQQVRKELRPVRVALIWSIVLMFTAGFLPGIFGILGSNASNEEHTSSLEHKLKEIESMYEKELITYEEYQKLRQQIIERV